MLKIRAPALLRSTFGIWGVVWGTLTNVEGFFKKSTNITYVVCFVVVGFIGTGLISLSCLTFVGLDKSLAYAAKPTIIFPSLGYLCGYLFKKRDRLLENCVKGRRFLFIIVANILIITKWIKFAVWLLRRFASPLKKPWANQNAKCDSQGDVSVSLEGSHRDLGIDLESRLRQFAPFTVHYT